MGRSRATSAAGALKVAGVLATVCVALCTTGCSGLTKVAAPDIVQAPALNNPAGALATRAGALGQFYFDMSNWAWQSDLLADEFTGTLNVSYITPIDQRVLPDGGPSAAGVVIRYPGPQSRINLLTAIASLEQYAPTPASRIGELFAALGTIETVMAEDMCSGVPLATVVNGLPVAGPQTTSIKLYTHALAQFDSAARYAADSARILNWVAAGRARALVDVDSLAMAAAVVVGVPSSYAYQGQYSATTNQQNQAAVSLQAVIAVADSKGGNGLNFVSAHDPRVPTVDLGLGSDGFTEDYQFAPYASVGAPLTVASGVEARLIEAEAALASGDAVTWLADLNALRADSADTHVTGLGPIADPVTPASRVDTMFTERAFWLFGTGHRQGDLRRLIRQYGRTQAQVFPVGLYKNTGQAFGSDVTFAVTGDNPNSSVAECLDRSP